MNGVLRLAYAAAGTLAEGAVAVAGTVPGEGKVLRSLRARRGLLERYRAWAGANRTSDRPLVWVHAASVGEGLQTRPLLQALRRRHAALQLAYTYFSPSAEAFANSLRADGLADFTDYLPWDTARDVGRALDALAPRAVIFSKLDVWPVLVEAAARRSIRLALISATMSAESARGSRLGAALLRDAYARLDAVGAIGPADAARLRTLGVREAALRVTGDTRYDQVWARAQSVDRASPPLAALLRSGAPTIVGGSTWPTDERILLAAWETLGARFSRLRLILAPHEPSAAHLAPLERWAGTQARRWARLSRGDIADADIVLVDRVGILGALYAVADVAFVGGGFHGAGLHSVIEPAAFATPVVFGPRYASSPDAGRLIDTGGARSVRDTATAVDAFARWLGDPGARREAGAHARDFVESGLGATDRTVEMVEEMLGLQSSGPRVTGQG